MSSCIDERLKDEIEALEAILMEDVNVEYNESEVPIKIKTVVFPSTADDTKQQYVCITLDVSLVKDYPDCEPVIKLLNPRGLDDSLIDDIQQAAKKKCIECIGQPVIFELIELIRERLTESNVPRCQCAVCLYDFSPGDVFTKTACYHYFHSHCLRGHAVSAERQWWEEQERLPAWQRRAQGGEVEFPGPTCPVCREPVACDVDALIDAPPPIALETARQFEVTAELRALQAQMAALFLYQQSRGGIIDVEAEENKRLLVTETESTPGSASEVPREPEPVAVAAPGPSPSGQRSAPRNKGPRSFHRHTRFKGHRHSSNS